MTSKIRTIVRTGAVVTTAAVLMTAALAEFDASPAEAWVGEVSASTPGTYTWTVPAGVTQISIKADGAQGGGDGAYGQGLGGHGAEVQAVVPVTPGQVITYVVGAQPTGQHLWAGGIGGGGNGGDSFLGIGFGGGGASWVKVGSTPLVVAGGGGGAAGGGVNGGDSGHMGGSLRHLGSANGMGGLPGGPPPGAMGAPGGDSDGLGSLSDCRYRNDGVAGQSGSSFQGGAGGAESETDPNKGGGGGGGGYYGGAGGGGGAYCSFPEITAAGGGGGGGTSYVGPHAGAYAVSEGFHSGNGAVVIEY